MTVPVRDWSVGEAEIYCAGAIFIERFTGDSVSLCLKCLSNPKVFGFRGMLAV